MDINGTELTVEQYMPLVYKIAKTEFPWAFSVKRKRPKAMDVDGDELIQEGALALMRLVRDFKPEKNVDFCDYAWTAIRYAMLHFAQAHGARIPTTQRPTASARRGTEGLRQKMKAVEECVLMSEASPEGHMESIVLTDNLRRDAEQNMAAVDNQDLLAHCLAKLGGKMSPEMLRVLEMRGGGAKLREIAAEIDCSIEQVRKLLNKAKKIAAFHLKDERELYDGS